MGRKMTSFIITIDDEPDVRELIKITLERGNNQVLTVKDGKTGLQTIQEKEPDLVLLDVNMPGLNGWDVLEEINRREDVDKVPVAMLTGEKLTITQILRKELDCLVDYIEKPFQPTCLREIVENILNKLNEIRVIRNRIIESFPEDGRTMASVFMGWCRTQMIHETLLEKLKRMKTECYNSEKRSRIEGLIQGERKTIERSKAKKEEIIELTEIERPLVTL